MVEERSELTSHSVEKHSDHPAPIGMEPASAQLHLMKSSFTVDDPTQEESFMSDQLHIEQSQNDISHKEVQPTPPPRKKKLEKLLKKQLQENQEFGTLLEKEHHNPVQDTEEENGVALSTGEGNEDTALQTTPKKTRRKNKHSK